MPQQSPLASALDRLIRWLEANAPAIAQGLQPGLTRAQIEAQVQHLPFRLPEEVYQFYQWRNGGSIESTCGSSSHRVPIRLLYSYQLLSLEEAIAERSFACEIYCEVCEDEEDEASDPHHWLPLFADEGNYYVVKGDTESQATAAIFHSDSYSDELELEFDSLATLISAIAECFETGAYYFENTAWLRCDRVREKQVWLKYQPQRTANSVSVLDEQIHHLSEKEWQQACFDLAESQHPQALAFFAQKLEDTEAEYQRCYNLFLGDPKASTLAEKRAAMETVGSMSQSRSRLIQLIRTIDTSEAIHYLFAYLLKSDDAETQNNIIMQLNQWTGNTLVYEVGRQYPEVIDRLRNLLQQATEDQEHTAQRVQKLLERLENAPD